MGTTYSIKIYTEKIINSIDLKESVEYKLNYLNSIFSTYSDSTEISKINLSKSKKINLSDDLAFVLNKALYYSQLSDGLYDPTVFPLVDLWGFGPTNINSKPNKNKVNELLKNISYKYISLNEKELLLNNSNLYIDLNSIAKGYAVDSISNLLLNMGFSDFMVEIGGEVKCIGENNKNKWIIGIINPKDENNLIKTNLKNMSIATSGNYNNYLIYEDIRYPHIINPKTGWPINNNIISASVITENCIDADAIATILMLLPYEKGIELVNNMNNVESLLFIDNNNEITMLKSKDFDKYVY
jgi:thiamine biosynthesis lipoprotein